MTSTRIPSGINRRGLLTTAATLSLLFAPALPFLRQGQAQTDPLPAGHGRPKQKGDTDFVSRVTQQGGPDFVPPAERIATFDNDGTLWVEHPMYTQMAFILDRVKVLLQQHPAWKEHQPL